MCRSLTLVLLFILVAGCANVRKAEVEAIEAFKTYQTSADELEDALTKAKDDPAYDALVAAKQKAYDDAQATLQEKYNMYEKEKEKAASQKEWLNVGMDVGLLILGCVSASAAAMIQRARSQRLAKGALAVSEYGDKLEQILVQFVNPKAKADPVKSAIEDLKLGAGGLVEKLDSAKVREEIQKLRNKPKKG